MSESLGISCASSMALPIGMDATHANGDCSATASSSGDANEWKRPGSTSAFASVVLPTARGPSNTTTGLAVHARSTGPWSPRGRIVIESS